MEEQICDRPAIDGIFDLGVFLGRNQAFGLLAGRCSAAQAEGISRLRNERLYKRVTEHWREFCPEYLKMSGSQADHIIRLWEEFGSGYFEVAQLTRISPETYRALAPAVEDGVLTLNGEQIELTVKNSRRVAAAVAQIRRDMPPKTAADNELTVADRVARLEYLCNAITEEIHAIPRDSGEPLAQYKQVVLNLFESVRNARRIFRY